MFRIIRSSSWIEREGRNEEKRERKTRGAGLLTHASACEKEKREKYYGNELAGAAGTNERRAAPAYFFSYCGHFDGCFTKVCKFSKKPLTNARLWCIIYFVAAVN